MQQEQESIFIYIFLPRIFRFDRLLQIFTEFLFSRKQLNTFITHKGDEWNCTLNFYIYYYPYTIETRRR